MLKPLKIEIHLNYTHTHTHTYMKRGTRLRSWLRHCTTSRKVADPIPDDVVGIFH